jgi:acyl-coenzyme A synthetase/AMP-(fatty) acid ligase
MLKVGGIWVAPREVEECLLAHEAVAECCVVGWCGADGLVVPLAFVVSRGTGDAALTARLQEHVKARLARYKYPRRVEYLDALPRNDRGKIARAALKARAASLSEGAP